MKPTLTRRDFLKVTGLLSLSAALPQHITSPSIPHGSSQSQNILIIVFDAWAAANTSLYGYPRLTTPNLERLARRAIIYHNNYSSGNFTTTGTASLLTGTLPWTHRALELSETVDGTLMHNNLFTAFPGYHRMAYTHNPVADILLNQFFTTIDEYVPWPGLYHESDYLINSLFRADPDIAPLSWSRIIKGLDGYSTSLYLSQLYGYLKRKRAVQIEDIAQSFPRGLPNHDDYTYFTLEQGIDWLSNQLTSVPQPFLGYYHFFPPHHPYNTRIEFYRKFYEDGFQPPQKPPHLFRGEKPTESIIRERSWYDEFILYMDAEFARLYDLLEKNGVLDNTWLILTSDHGEMFERGVFGHITQVLHQPLVKVPLLIFPPGGRDRLDVYDNTSAIDLLPTLQHVNGQEISSWAEGRILPPYSPTNSNSNHDVFALHGDTGIDGRINKVTAMLVRDHYKLMWYFGYDKLGRDKEMLELYDLDADPEEINNLHPAQTSLAAELLLDLKSNLIQADDHYVDTILNQ
jgi:arylsulfatase A-like enzyme